MSPPECSPLWWDSGMMPWKPDGFPSACCLAASGSPGLVNADPGPSSSEIPLQRGPGGARDAGLEQLLRPWCGQLNVETTPRAEGSSEVSGTQLRTCQARAALCAMLGRQRLFSDPRSLSVKWLQCQRPPRVAPGVLTFHRGRYYFCYYHHYWEGGREGAAFD